jgi:hypothetical protein
MIYAIMREDVCLMGMGFLSHRQGSTLKNRVATSKVEPPHTSKA